MKKAIRRADPVEYVTFEDFVKIGLEQEGASVVNGKPWAFSFCGHT